MLLLGPRQTGKSTLIRRLAPDLEINLSDEETYLEFLRQPGLLKQTVGRSRTVCIDEIQRIPSLLNSVHTSSRFYGREGLLVQPPRTRSGYRQYSPEYAIGDPTVPPYARGYGSPTILVDGRDVSGAVPFSEDSCRLYSEEQGYPPVLV